MEGFLVGLLFVSVVLFIWAVCLGTFGLVSLPLLFFGSLCFAIIAADS